MPRFFPGILCSFALIALVGCSETTADEHGPDRVGSAPSAPVAEPAEPPALSPEHAASLGALLHTEAAALSVERSPVSGELIRLGTDYRHAAVVTHPADSPVVHCVTDNDLDGPSAPETYRPAPRPDQPGEGL